ncbi:MAG: ATP-dependent zinc metalloprotease FtsH [Opitutales bacterium]|nr:ATP-dependent zinc metalloprotease FtsH [Opitutales bacterium]
MGKKKNSKKPLKITKKFQAKSLLVWSFLLLILLGLNSLAITPERCLHLTVNQVFELARSRLIQSVEIQEIETGGAQWYRIRGTLKKDGVEIIPALQKDSIWGQKNDAKKKAMVLPDKFEAEGRLTDARFNELTSDHFDFVLKEKPAGTMLSSFLSSTLPFAATLLLLYFLFMRQIRSAGKGAMGFGRSRMRLLQEDKKKVTFQEVAGCDEAKEEVQEIVEFLKNPQKFQEIGGRIPKGVLMVGAPGTGKTLLAKAIAGEADVPFFSISGSDFVEMFVGVGASRVRDMFEQAKQNSPCLVFIDEIDAVGRKRGAGLGGGNDEREQTLNALLVEMDGFESREGIIIVAATNRPDVLDSALLRPGRFDRQVVLDLPDIHGREEILRVHAKKIKLSPEVDLGVVARNTTSYSGADLENLLNEAALLAARFSKKWVEPCDLDEARDKISWGRERKKLMDEKDKRITAYHEAGHAIIQALVGDGLITVYKVTIIPRGQSLGSTMMQPSKDILNYSKTHSLNEICCAMGGRVAEEMTFHEQSSGASADIRSATKLARRMVCDWGMSDLGPVAFGDNQEHLFLGQEIAREQNYSEKTAQRIDEAISNLIAEQYQRACTLLEEKKACLELLAQSLLKYETLEGKHVYEIVQTGALNTEELDRKLSQPSQQEASTTSESAAKEAVEAKV